VEITLIDRRNFHLFQPLSYQLATGALSPGEVAYPLRAVFKRNRNVRVLLDADDAVGAHDATPATGWAVAIWIAMLAILAGSPLM
jgi:NADH dehydrogenase